MEFDATHPVREKRADGVEGSRGAGAPAPGVRHPQKVRRRFSECRRGMGIGGWLTNYKRFNVLPNAWRGPLSPGDFEHFETYITEQDVRNIASFGMDHIRLGFDQIVLEEAPGVYRERTFRLLDAFAAWCESGVLVGEGHRLHLVEPESAAIVETVSFQSGLVAEALVLTQKEPEAPIPIPDAPDRIGILTRQMKQAADELEFETAAKIRDMIAKLKEQEK